MLLLSSASALNEGATPLCFFRAQWKAHVSKSQELCGDSSVGHVHSALAPSPLFGGCILDAEGTQSFQLIIHVFLALCLINNQLLYISVIPFLFST